MGGERCPLVLLTYMTFGMICCALLCCGYASHAMYAGDSLTHLTIDMLRRLADGRLSDGERNTKERDCWLAPHRPTRSQLSHEWSTVLHRDKHLSIRRRSLHRQREDVMGKSSRRKQTITIMDKRGAGASANVEEHLSFLLPPKDNIDSLPKTEGMVYRLMRELSDAPSLMEQIAVLQAAKQQLRAQMMECMQTGSSLSSPSDSIAPCVIVLDLYLLPVTLPLRKSLDWVFDVFAGDHVSVDSSLQTEIIRKVELFLILFLL